jgi:hypothetical protein
MGLKPTTAASSRKCPGTSCKLPGYLNGLPGYLQKEGAGATLVILAMGTALRRNGWNWDVAQWGERFCIDVQRHSRYAFEDESIFSSGGRVVGLGRGVGMGVWQNTGPWWSWIERKAPGGRHGRPGRSGQSDRLARTGSCSRESGHRPLFRRKECGGGRPGGGIGGEIQRVE